MVFLYFGATPDSWAISNYQYSFAQNLPAPVQQVWDRLGSVHNDASKAGTMISWMSTTADGSYVIMTKGNELLSNRQDILAAAHPPTSVAHIALSPQGGWFIRFNDDTVQLLPTGFPTSFAHLVGPYLNVNFGGRQHSRIHDVFFGAQGATIVRTDQGLVFDGVPRELQSSLEAFTHGELRTGYVLGLHTVLCSWDARYYFLEAQARDGPPRYIYQLPTQQIPNEMVASIISGQIPPAHTIPNNGYSTPALPPRPPPPPMFPGESQPAMPVPIRARYERQFHAERGGKAYLTGVEAAMMFQESGLPRAELARIWDQTDKDRNGQFDKDEFVHAMWLIELHTGRVERPGAEGLQGIQHVTMGAQYASQGPASYQQPQAPYQPQPSPYQQQPSPHQQPPPPYQPQQPTYQQPQPPYQQPQQPQPPYHQPQTPYQQPQPPYHPQQPPYQQQQTPYQQPQSQYNGNPPQPSTIPPPGEISKATTCLSCGNGLAPTDTAYHCPCGYLCHACPSTKPSCPHALQSITLTLSAATKAHAKGTLACSGCAQAIKKGSVAWHCQKCWDRDLDAKCWRKKKRHCKHVKLGKVDMVRTDKMGKKEKAEAWGAVGEVAGALFGA